MKRFLYERYKQDFIGYLVQDYLHEIPDDISDPAIKVMEEQGRKLRKLFLFMASQLHHRMLTDRKNSAMYEGMLVNLKILDSLIGKIPDPVRSAAPVAAKKNPIKDALDGITEFTKWLSTPPAQPE